MGLDVGYGKGGYQAKAAPPSAKPGSLPNPNAPYGAPAVPRPPSAPGQWGKASGHDTYKFTNSRDPNATHKTPGEYETPGAAEDYWSRYADNFGANKPTNSAQFWNSVQGAYNTPTNAQGAYDAYRTGDHASGLSQAYDQAAKDTTTGLNNQLAARGLLGSSSGVGLIGHALTDLRAGQARDEGAYRLQDSQLGGSLASAADSQGMSRTGMFGDLASGADTNANSNFLAGLQGARTAQDAHTARGQFAVNSMMGAGGLASGVAQSGLSNIVAGDSGTNDALGQILMAMGSNKVLGAQDLAAIMAGKTATEQQGIANLLSAAKIATSGGGGYGAAAGAK